MELFKIREPRATDLSFIEDSFIKSMRNESALGRSCSARVFFSEYQKVIDHILLSSKVAVACDPTETDTIYGYLIYDSESAHYAFVKLAWCKLGIARALINYAFPNAKTIRVTHSTKIMKRIMESHPEIIFNPFELYKKGA